MIIETSGELVFALYIADASCHAPSKVILNILHFYAGQGRWHVLYVLKRSLNLTVMICKGVVAQKLQTSQLCRQGQLILSGIVNKGCYCSCWAQGAIKTAERAILELCDKVDAVPMPDMGGTTPFYSWS